MPIPAYWSFGRTDLGLIEVPARVGSKLDPNRHIVDLFILQSDPNRAPYDVRGIGGNGYWEGFLVDRGFGPSNSYTWGNISSYVSTNDFNNGYTINTSLLQTHLQNMSNLAGTEEEVWYMPNIEATVNQFTPTYFAPDHYNPSPDTVAAVEKMLQGYRAIAQIWRSKRPTGCFGYYMYNAMLHDGWNPGSMWLFDKPKLDSEIKLWQYRNNRAAMSQVGKKIVKSKGAYDACDVICGAVYTYSTWGIDRIKYEVSLALKECQRLRRPGQLTGLYIGLSHLDGVACTPAELTAIGAEMRRAGCQRAFIFGYASLAEPVTDHRYWPYWKTLFDHFSDAFY